MERLLKKKKSDGAGVDIISDLPEPILHHILSFMYTKEAIQISLVAKRWRYLWKSVPHLNFHYHFSCKETGKKKGKQVSLLSGKKVFHEDENMHFGDRVLFLRDAFDSVLQLRLSGYRCVDSGRIDTWLIYTLKRHVKEVYLDISFPTLPRYSHQRLKCLSCIRVVCCVSKPQFQCVLLVH
ncbi:hypothetical protein IFM89_005260 [Coptis chinensis]|uniref:F-box domain-containing protein n=1 Tax=Coptis chinensis TaxID=261450 RepID=A0A835M8N8_9MAGN|nr:hypothetical protein IFM89_005260 [Coptis chinensis]